MNSCLTRGRSKGVSVAEREERKGKVIEKIFKVWMELLGILIDFITYAFTKNSSWYMMAFYKDFLNK